MRRKSIRRGAVFATVVGLGMTGMVIGTTLMAPTALANGANQSGPYDPTPTSQAPCPNNQGNGNSPCNGTVGNADDKNPPGQQPGGSDNNHGYECDGNKGVGNDGGNPAHTGCTEQPTTETTVPGHGGGGGGGENDTTPPADVLPTTETQAPAVVGPTSDVEGETVAAPAAAAPAQLPFTGPGTLTTALAVAGALMFFGGLALVIATKEPKRARLFV